MTLSFTSIFRLSISLGLLCGLSLLSACKKEEADTPESLRVGRVTLTLEANGVSQSYEATGVDNPLGEPPAAEIVGLRANTTYTLRARFFDMSDPGAPIELNPRIKAAAASFLLCLEGAGAIANARIVATDSDPQGQALGLTNQLEVGDNLGPGTLRLNLRAGPVKGAPNRCASGRLEVELGFPVFVQ
jgi:hypothetical protein